MKSLSQNSLVNTSINSQSSKKSALIEKLTDCSKDKILANKKKGTPAIKQAKRDKESKERWKVKATQRSIKINIKDKTIADIRESCERSKKNAKERSSKIDLLCSQLKAERLNHINELQKYKKNIEYYQLKEVKESEDYTRLEKIVEKLQETNKRLLELSNTQSNSQEEIRQLNIEINNYMTEKHYNPGAAQTKEIAKKIVEELMKIDSSIQKSEAEISMEAELHNEQVLKTKESSQHVFSNDLRKYYQSIANQTRGALEQLKTIQIVLRSSLKIVRERFTNKKNRDGDFQSHEKLKNHSYSIAIIRLMLLYVLAAAMSFRAAAKSMKINALFFNVATPSHTIVNDWCKKIGFFVYHQPKEKMKESVWIVDFSIQIGKQKLMLVLRVDLNKVENWKKNKSSKKEKKAKLKINFHDVEVIHMKILESTSYTFTLSELNQILEKCGTPSFILSDEGSDLAKGIRIFIENNPGIEHLNDISHKISNILKSELENNLKWKEFCQLITKIKQKIKHSIIAHICPPQFRQKVRFLNVRDPIKWAFQMLNIKVESLSKNEREYFVTYIQKPLLEFKNEIIQWHEIADFITEVESEIKHNGLNRGDDGQIQSTSKILTTVYQKQKISENTMKIIGHILAFVKIQESKLSPGQTVIGSSDLIESMFGKWKNMAPENSMAGITDKIFILPLLTVKLTNELIKKALEEVHMQQIEKWRNDNLGQTIYAKRRAVLNMKKRGKADRNLGKFPEEIQENAV